MLSLEHPVRMLFVQFASDVDHFGFYPDSEAEPLVGCGAHQRGDASRKLAYIGLPVPEGIRVGITMIFVAEPTVVHHEQFTAHCRKIVHHFVHNRLIYSEVHTFPTIEQYLAFTISVGHTVFAAPAVEVA